MGAFFQSWALWEKMCFVLAAAIVAVILLGCGKVVYNHWRLRKYTKLAAVKAQHRQAIEQRPSVRVRKGREVPFGVRAIESGVEVDGVWISRSNTPGPSTTGSPAPSIMLEPSSAQHVPASDRGSTVLNQQTLEVPQPVHGYAGSSQNRNSTSQRLSTPGLDHERIPRTSTASDHVPRARATYQPRRSSGLRFSNSHDNSTALAALEGRRMASTPEVPGSEASHSSSNSSEENYVPRRPQIQRDSSDILFDPSYLRSGGAPTARSDHQTVPTGFSRPYAADEEQQLPRIRLSCMGSNNNPDSPPEHRYMFEGTTPGNEYSDPFVTPAGTPMGSPTMTYTEEPPSFASFVNASPSHDDRFQNLNDVEQDYPQSQSMPNALQQSDGNSQSYQPRVARTINSGFEVLRPGSFSRPRETESGWHEKTGMDGQYDYGNGVHEPGKKRFSRKLQRKRADSKESRFKEEV